MGEAIDALQQNYPYLYDLNLCSIDFSYTAVKFLLTLVTAMTASKSLELIRHKVFLLTRN